MIYVMSESMNRTITSDQIANNKNNQIVSVKLILLLIITPTLVSSIITINIIDIIVKKFVVFSKINFLKRANETGTSPKAC